MSQRPDKPLPLIPQSSIVITSSTSAQYEEQGEAMAKEDVVLPFADVLSRSVTPDPTRREYALLELLRSERTYVSDLVLLRDYQIPLASGRLSSMSNIWQGVDATIRQYLGVGPPVSDTDVGPVIPPGSSSGRPRPSTIASNVSAMSFGSIFTLRPMKTKDVNIVFSNIEELAAFSEEFLHQLESALGELIEGNEGEVFVGRLFLDSLPQMEPLYETYVMNQPHALEHYHRLSKTFQFDVYFPRSQILAHKSSNAWDLPSLLIKPVQRLLHYPQLLAAILAETPDTHHDKAALFEAHVRMTEMARRLNERWRQQKTVGKVLAGVGLVDSAPARGSAPLTATRKKSGLKVIFLGSVGLGRIVFPWPATDKVKNLALSEVDPVVKVIKAGGERLKRYEELMVAFMTETMNWADTMRNLMHGFEEWTFVFLQLLWAGCRTLQHGRGKLPVSVLLVCLIGDMKPLVNDRMKVEINVDLAWTVQSLKNLIAAPLCLIEEIRRLEPLHYDFLHLNFTKSYPPSSSLEASQSYIALRGKLSEELPTYLTLLDKGMAACILKFAYIQWRFYSNVHDLWKEFWDVIKVRGDTTRNHGATETVRIWSRRFSEVDEPLMRLNIVQPPDLSMPYVRNTQHLRPPSESLRHYYFLKPTRPYSRLQDRFQIPILYVCRAVRSYQPPDGTVYWGLPFSTLIVGQVYEILAETGPPSSHPDLPLHVDDGGDCLVLARYRRTGTVGWTFVTFMCPAAVDERIGRRASSSEREHSPSPSW